jgi:exodeoxyribonuclease V beta subunit
MNELGDFDLLKSPLTGTTLIEASAGTGKTYAITGLVVRLILERNLPINEILVVTFTEAATNELKDRIRKRLREALEHFSGGGVKDELLEGIHQNLSDWAAARRRLACVINDFDRASIFTIHSFCAKILHDHAFESGMLLDTELVTEQEHFVMEIVHDFWRQHCYHASPLFFNHALARNFSPDSLRAIAGKSIANPYLKVIPETRIPDCSELEIEFRHRFEKVQEAWPSAREEVGTLLMTADPLNRTRYKKASIPGWIQAMDDYLSGGCRGCNTFDKFEKFTASHLQSAVKKGGKAPPHLFFLLCDDLDLTWQRLSGCFDQCLLGLRSEFIDTVRRELSKRKLNKNIVYYDDLLLLVDRALQGPGADSLAAIVREKFKAALIDEFQDTDAIQYAIFEKIFGGGKGTLFLIGDPKQAIYGFRGADIFTYMNAAKRTALRFTLGENWRSEPVLTEAVNTIFARAGLPFVYPDIQFRPVQPAREKEHNLLKLDGEEEPPLQLWWVNTDRVSEGKPITRAKARAVIPQAVAGEISRLLSLARQNRAVIGGRCLVEGDIAVLVRRNDEAHLIQQALSDLRIHSVLYNIGNLFETPETMEVERVLAAIADPADERRLKIALVTELLGVSGERLDRLIKDEAGWEEWLIRFGEYHELWSRHGFFRMFRRLLSREAVLPRLMSLADGERRCTNILHLSEVLHQATVESNCSMLGLVKWLSIQRDSASPRLEEHQLRLESDENAVKLVTVHKSKGLEYPVVFCPFIGDGSKLRRRNEPFSFHNETDGMRLTLDLGSPQQAENVKSAEREQLAENLRLLYVAMTRAKHRCYLVWGRFRDAETSAPAYLFHQPRSGEPIALPDAVANHFPTLNDGGLRLDLQEIQRQAKGSIEVMEMPHERGTGQTPLDEETATLECRPFSGSINHNWGITSFSSLLSAHSRNADWTDRDETPAPEITVEADRAAPLSTGRPPQNMFAFPRGAAAGIFLHDLFEHLDFASQDQTVICELIAATLKAHRFESLWVGPVCDMVRKILEVPLDSVGGGLTLARIQKVDRLSELEFYFPLQRLSESKIRDIFSRCLGKGKDGLSSRNTDSNGGPESPENPESPFSKGGQGGFEVFPSSMGRLVFRPVEGFMRGFIDLVFCFEGRFYLVDWKSNFLGSRTEDYDQAALQKAMEEGSYHLQYTLYAVAIHQYLKTRIPEYRYESHFGGVLYVFLRGVDPAKGRDYGVYRCRPTAASIEGLCTDLIGKAER